MPRKRVFISFDYDHDQGAKSMLVGQAQHPDTPFDVADGSVRDHLPGDWREKVRRRLAGVDVVIVLCGEHTHLATGVATELAIAREVGRPYFLLEAYPDRRCMKPSSAKESDKIYQWTWDNLKALVGGAR